MKGVKGSYRELTGLQPVELTDITTEAASGNAERTDITTAVASGKAERTDITTAAELLSDNSR